MKCTDIIYNYPIAVLQCKVDGSDKICRSEFLLPIGANKFSKLVKIPLNTL